ncbi:MAG: flavodoxin domain-containing protein [Spirochaetales bacterium]|nr:flavodoxin domain-containing protein [Spirochaetales bacterium]
MNMIVVCYSGKGSNKFLAEKISEALDCELIKLEPRVPGLVLPATFSRISMGNKPVNTDLTNFDRVILCGPLYMGSIAAPCNDFMKKYSKQIKTLDIATCCASTDKKKNDQFGYGRVFNYLKEKTAPIAGIFEAFPIELVMDEDQKNDDQATMNTRLNNENFKGAIQLRLDKFINEIKHAPEQI